MRIIDTDDLKQEFDEDILNHAESPKTLAIEEFFKEFKGRKADKTEFSYLQERILAHLKENLSEESDEYQKLKSKIMCLKKKEALFHFLEEELFK